MKLLRNQNPKRQIHYDFPSLLLTSLPLFHSGTGGAEGSSLAFRSPCRSPPLSPSASIISAIPFAQCGILPQPGPPPSRRGPGAPAGSDPFLSTQRQLQDKTHQVHLNDTSRPVTTYSSLNPAIFLQIFTLHPLRFFHLVLILGDESIGSVGMKAKRH